MPRFSKPVEEDENGELIIPGAYGAAPGGICERRSTFEWDNHDRALINVDELSVELSDDESDESGSGTASSRGSGSSTRSQAEQQTRTSTRATTHERSISAPSSHPVETDEEMGGVSASAVSTTSSQQENRHPQCPQRTNLTSNDLSSSQDPTEHAIPTELLDAEVVQAPHPPPPKSSLLARTFGCQKNPSKKGSIARALIFVSLAVGLGMIVLWTTRRGDDTQSPFHSSSSDSSNSLYDPPSASLAYRSKLGLQDIIAHVTAADKLQPNWESPYWAALYWLLFEDPLQLTTEDPNAVQQRYLLAAFYFVTSTPYQGPAPQQGRRFRRGTWNHCAAPEQLPLTAGGILNRNSTTANHHFSNCTHQVLTQERPSRIFEAKPQSWRWLSAASECDWAGVECNEQGRVTAIELAEYGLSGTIMEELSHLDQLQVLSLPYNEHLSGSIPPVLFGKLTKLFLQNNQHNGTITFMGQDIGKVPLEVLNLAGNALTGSIPTELYNVTHLRQLSLQENRLTGMLPMHAKWPDLEVLRLNQNQLSGFIPTTLPVTTLRVLDLSDNNKLTGNIPSELGVSTKLLSLGLANAQLTGKIPLELYGCTRLTSLDLQQNILEGTMATQIGNLRQLQQLFWQDNLFTGTLPTELGQLSKIKEFHINGNGFEGSVPEQFCNIGAGDFFLAHNAVVVADCTEENGTTAVSCPDGCCSHCCKTSTGRCTPIPSAILGLGNRTGNAP